MYGDPRYLRLLLDWSYRYLVASGSLDSLVVSSVRFWRFTQALSSLTSGEVSPSQSQVSV